MSFAKWLKNDLNNNFVAHFKKWPRFFLAIYTFSGLLAAFAAGMYFPLHSNVWLFDLGGALLFWCVAFWGVGVLAKGRDVHRP